MERQKEQEIRDYLEKIGLQYGLIHQDENSVPYVGLLFQTIAYITGNFKLQVKDSLKDLISLCEDYIQKIDEG